MNDEIIEKLTIYDRFNEPGLGKYHINIPYTTTKSWLIFDLSIRIIKLKFNDGAAYFYPNLKIARYILKLIK